MRTLILATLLFIVASETHAQQQPIVRVEITPQTVIVGQSAELTVTVLVPTWFTRPTVYPTFELANAITRQPDDNSYPFRERVGNESWSGIARSYDIYPLLGATYKMSGQTMTVFYANPGAEALTAEIALPEVMLRATVPAGAESLEPYIAGQRLELTLDIDSGPDDLSVGDAVVIDYTAELDGLPAIFLPPLAPELAFDGVSTYRDVPEVADDARARRSERVTLVFDAGGEFLIPDAELRFWNTATNAIETVTAAGVTLAVNGPPARPMSDDETVESSWLKSILIAIGVALLGLALSRGLPLAMQRIRVAVEHRRASEHYAYRSLVKALGSNNTGTAYHALLAWLDRLAPGMSARTFAARYGDAPLREAIDTLSANIYANAGNSPEPKPVSTALSAARKRYLARHAPGRTTPLPPLNP